MFLIASETLDRNALAAGLQNDKAGAIVVFEGWVRNHNEGKKVKSLEYQVYKELALKEGEKILAEAKTKFNLHEIRSVHREGHLALGDMAIWIGATASHRDDAFKATRYVIDEIKHRLPVWKKEHYVHEKPEWVFCKDHHHHVHFSEVDFYQKQAKLTDQEKLKSSHVVVVGAGGLGCPVLISLAQAGVGRMIIVDFDKISLSNLHRQSLYTPNLAGEKKAKVAATRLMEMNPFIKVDAVTEMVELTHLEGDLVIDCTDNMDTKYFLHDACMKKGIPLISASVFKHEGQIRTFKDKGCLRCLTHVTPDDSLLGNCNDFGVLGATVNMLGSLQASEAIQYLTTGTNATLTHTSYFNLKDMSLLKVKNVKKENCPTCKGEGDVHMNPLEVSHGKEILDIRQMSDEEVLKMNLHDVALGCHHGVRSKRLAKIMRNDGKEVFSLKGGVS